MKKNRIRYDGTLDSLRGDVSSCFSRGEKIGFVNVWFALERWQKDRGLSYLSGRSPWVQKSILNLQMAMSLLQILSNRKTWFLAASMCWLSYQKRRSARVMCWRKQKRRHLSISVWTGWLQICWHRLVVSFDNIRSGRDAAEAFTWLKPKVTTFDGRFTDR